MCDETEMDQDVSMHPCLRRGLFHLLERPRLFTVARSHLVVRSREGVSALLLDGDLQLGGRRKARHHFGTVAGGVAHAGKYAWAEFGVLAPASRCIL